MSNGNETTNATAGAASARGLGRRTEPAFKFENEDNTDNFNLVHRDDYDGPIPEDQRKISYDVYEARNVLKLLQEDRSVGKKGPYEEFIKRVVQAARAGCVARYAEPTLAAQALTQIRADIVRRIGRPLAYRYLAYLAAWAAVASLLGVVAILVGWLFGLAIAAYGWVIIGATAGAWFSVAASRWQMAFETLPSYLDVLYEPAVRMLFVAILALAFALFLDLSLVSITVGQTDLSGFKTSEGIAILVGFIAGIGERALSVQLIERAQKVLTPGAK